MPRIRAQIEVAADDTKPANKFVMTPWFNQGGVAETGGTDWSALANDLAQRVSDWLSPPGGREVRVKLYNWDTVAAPHFPEADVVKNTGLAPASNLPRELAVCLSFYAERNLARQRGRIYVPAVLIGITPVTLRPSAAMRDRVAALSGVFTGLGGIDIDWVVYSRRDNAVRTVSHYWVDDEWDVQRRRGLPPAARTEANVSG